MTESLFLPIDIPTLAASRALMQIMLAGLLAWVGAGHEQGKGARLWAVGFLLNGISLFLFSMRVPAEWESLATSGNHLALALANGRAGTVAQILSDRSLVTRVDDSNRYFEVELAPGADPQVLLRRLVESGAGIERFELVQPSLHQIFLDKVGARGIELGMTGQG